MKRRVVKAVVAKVVDRLEKSVKLTCRDPEPIRRAAWDAWNQALHMSAELIKGEFRKALRK